VIDEPPQRTGHAVAVLALAGPFNLALSLKAAASFLPASGPLPTALRAGIHLDGRPELVEVGQSGRRLEAIGPAHLSAAKLRKIAAWLVNADLDPRPFYQLGATHLIMGPVANSLCGLKPLRPASLFEMLVIAITEQQLSLAAAFHIRQRLVERFGSRLGGIWLFPTPASLAEAPLSALKACGLSGQKAEYVAALAGEIAAKRLDLAALKAMSDAEARDLLARQRGLGDWSINYILTRGLGRPDCLPAGDVRLRRVVGRYLAGGSRLSPEELQRALAPFAPFRSLAAYYLAVHARLFPQRRFVPDPIEEATS
jgi:3-methyladenine DNA glycosylase/8-oxoguanine DNA glycosylase